MQDYHVPVLLDASVTGLNIQPGGHYADLTFGGGGHSREILRRMDQNARLLAFDQDKDVLRNLPDDKRIIFAQSNFKYLCNFVRYYQLGPLDGILADLGVSSHHFDDEQRGFSFRYDGPLDMRMNQQADLTAEVILNEYSEQQLADIFYLYGELDSARRIARNICEQRKTKRIANIADFKDLLAPFGRNNDKKYMAQAFQAVRIEVNGEMNALKTMLESTAKVLRTGGRLSVITYHSLEDRLVKNFIKAGNFEGKVEQDFYGHTRQIYKTVGKMITPTPEEQEANPRSRSAKLRIAEKV
ncbi:MAG: 16S rRNA (cytosine(1402)-N(4))-methyltransferase RsmH [Paludibacteraceae bacterium]|nr:16S rRNA (cytosine(1402)-N(4))-methyltransferase RsmH [Paludibacteraceae bacterium]